MEFVDILVDGIWAIFAFIGVGALGYGLLKMSVAIAPNFATPASKATLALALAIFVVCVVLIHRGAEVSGIPVLWRGGDDSLAGTAHPSKY